MNSFLEINEVRRARPLLGTFVEICAGGTRKDKLHRAIDKAFEAIALVQRLMSFHDEASDISQINRLAFKYPVLVHPFTYEVLKTAQEISIQTNGLFDCTIAPLLIRWKYLPRVNNSRNALDGNFRDLELFPSCKVRFRKPLAIDLGGIAKGFAVDQAVKELKKQGIPYGSVNAGGDLKIFGNKKQPLYVRSVKNAGNIFLLGFARQVAFATSAHYFSQKQWQRKQVSAIVNPRDHSPCLNPVSVSVFAPFCMVADALTKAVMLEGNPRASFLKKFSARAILFEDPSRN